MQLVAHDFFQIYSTLNYFFGFSLILQKDRIIKIALCEWALINTEPTFDKPKND